MNLEQVYIFFFIFIRATTFIMVSPLLGDRAVHRMVKIGLGGMLALAVYGTASKNLPAIDLTLITALITVFSEILIGLLMGFMLQFLFAAAQMAGDYIGMDMGLAMATELDPNFNAQTSVISQFYYILIVMSFILLEGHHFLIQAFEFSFIAVPVASVHLSDAALTILIKTVGTIFAIAIKIAAPAIVALFLTSISMGIAARVVPQMNIFFVAIPLRIAVGLFAMILSFPLFFYVFEKLLLEFEMSIDQLIRAL